MKPGTTHQSLPINRVPVCIRHIALLIGVIFCVDLQASGLTLSLTAPDHHGYNISCFSGNDGAIDLTVAGGTAPYTYDWSNGATTQDLSNLVAGYYRVTVTDAQSLVAYEDITLTEPRALEAEVVVYEYPNGFNVSCYQCYNGNLTVATGGGVAPYSYAWNDGSTTQNRQSLGAGLLKLAITDLNGCIFETDATLTEPESNDWKMGGNTGSNPPDQFIGTSDEKDVVFKTNGTERFRLLSDGRLRSGSLSSTEGGLLRAGADGTFEIVERTCVIPYPLWRTDGNCIVDNEWLGSTNHRDLVIKTDNIERMRIKADGKVGIGTTPPNNSSYAGFRIG